MNRLLAGTLVALAAALAVSSVSAARGEGPVRLLVNGLIDHDIAALDADGRLVGYGDGPGIPGQVSTCPGAGATVEYVNDIGVSPDELSDPKAPQGFVVRALDEDLRASKPILIPRSWAIHHLECLSADGSQFATLVSDDRRGLGVYRYDDGRRRTVGRLPNPGAKSGLLSRGRAYSDRTVIDVRTGARTVLAKAPAGLEPVAVSSDGRSVAAATSAGDLVVVDASSGRVTAMDDGRRVEAGVWLDNGRLAVSWQPRGGDALWFVYTRTLKRLRTFRADTVDGHADGNRLVLEVEDRLQRRNRNGKRIYKGPDLPGEGSIAAVVR